MYVDIAARVGDILVSVSDIQCQTTLPAAHHVDESQAARNVVTMTSKVNGKTNILTPCRSETPENFITKN